MGENIDQICQRVAKQQPSTLKACNYFVQAVFRELFGSDQPMVAGQAAAIAARLNAAPFNPLGRDADAAISHAQKGNIVVGGSVSAGHVFIVSAAGKSNPRQPTPWYAHGKPVVSRGGAPIVYNGSINPKIPVPLSSVDVIFSKQDQAGIVYGWIDDPRAK